MLSLVWRQVKKAATLQLALAVLFASAVTVFLIYSSYIARENTLAGARIAARIPAGHHLVETGTPVPPAKITTLTLDLVGGWQQTPLLSSRGQLSCAIIGNDGPLSKIAPPGSIIVHQSLAERLGLRPGSRIELQDRGQSLEVEVYQV